MDQLNPLGTAIPDNLVQTRRIFEPLLVQNAASIKSTSCKTFPYGPHPRQALDIYYPLETNGTEPIFIFLYGGGLVRGDKTLPDNYAQGLVHANLGHFFADKLGYLTVIPDYRLISHGAKFPSGAEDVAAVLGWVKANHTGSGGSRDLYMMGNSAGGIHLSTFLFSPVFAEARDAVMKGGPDSAVTLRGAVMLSVPFHFEAAHASRVDVLKAYYEDRIDQECPLGLLKASLQHQSGDPLPGVRVMILTGSLDPEDEIMAPNRDFVGEWEKNGSAASKKALSVAVMEGQNHISPPLSLGTGKMEEEAWGYQVRDWIESA